MPKTKLFLLPHQDDEFGVFHLLDVAVAADNQPLIVYLTDGAFGRATAAMRNAESTNVLERLGIRKERIWFLGLEQSVPNLGLRHHLENVFTSLLAYLQYMNAEIEGIYSPAFEGGHPDHDAAALLAVALGRHLNISNQIWQFPLYNSYRCTIRPYRVLTPILEAGAVLREQIPPARRAEHLSLCLHYPSQARTFVGLFPFILGHYIASGTQQLQPLHPLTTLTRPHDGLLLYERRRWLTWAAFEQDVRDFRMLRLS
ncbi:PIG-L deacetylase family protein [Microvirga arsenatis]|uniref:PIG-L family deacetylase n=1 Tax=Microvirga arsenatis TaxID=2692265 RepID=A0ABW9Z2V5_9HYPH|nr:PIG-L family deacetylase [Microvirga arsenatis]NBJ27016.1 PIG-L family deacetylase [Microvirga arsenatis]